jgi:septal ring factor EnvC (AmiA/AmiB activator)
MRKIKIFKLWLWQIIPVGVIFALASCATNGTVDVWGDANLVARQRAEIEQLQRDIADLRTQLRDAQQATQSGIESIDRAYAKLESSLAGTTSLQSSIDALTKFARQCLTEIDRLRKHQSENTGIQPTDWREDATIR